MAAGPIYGFRVPLWQGKFEKAWKGVSLTAEGVRFDLTAPSRAGGLPVCTGPDFKKAIGKILEKRSEKIPVSKRRCSWRRNTMRERAPQALTTRCQTLKTSQSNAAT